MDLTLAAVNLAIVILLSPLYEGVLRKVKALVHSRKGPPISQVYTDILKLLGKEDLRISKNPMIAIAPVVCFASILVVALLVPLGTINSPLSLKGDIIAIVYFISLAAFSIMLGAAATVSPYAFIGLNRKLMLYLVSEIIIVITLFTGVIKSGSFNLFAVIRWNIEHGPSLSYFLAAVPFFLVLQSQLSKLPFDIAEAEQELMEGPFIEASGPRLALFKWSFYAKQIIYSSLFCEVFIPWPKTGLIYFDIPINLVKAMLVMLVVGVIDVVNPRLKIDQAVKYYAGVGVAALAALAFALIGA
jgi:formate hydrogenlyase subunit 4